MVLNPPESGFVPPTFKLGQQELGSPAGFGLAIDSRRGRATNSGLKSWLSLRC